MKVTIIKLSVKYISELEYTQQYVLLGSYCNSDC